MKNLDCRHEVVQGDNYGSTCMDCGAQITGMGFWAEGESPCMHEYHDGICIYCEGPQ